MKYKYFKSEHKISLRKLINKKTDDFNEFELKFLTNLYNRKTYSSKQWKILKRICKKFDTNLISEYSKKENQAIKAIHKSSHSRNVTKTDNSFKDSAYSDRNKYRKKTR